MGSEMCIRDSIPGLEPGRKELRHNAVKFRERGLGGAVVLGIVRNRSDRHRIDYPILE